MPRKHNHVTVTDLFCGAGGSSFGATQAGAEIFVALNHWELAVETHNSNFPNTLHEVCNISACDPRRYPSTRVLIGFSAHLERRFRCREHSLRSGPKTAHIPPNSVLTFHRIGRFHSAGFTAHVSPKYAS